MTFTEQVAADMRRYLEKDRREGVTPERAAERLVAAGIAERVPVSEAHPHGVRLHPSLRDERYPDEVPDDGSGREADGRTATATCP